VSLVENLCLGILDLCPWVQFGVPHHVVRLGGYTCHRIPDKNVLSEVETAGKKLDSNVGMDSEPDWGWTREGNAPSSSCPAETGGDAFGDQIRKKSLGERITGSNREL